MTQDEIIRMAREAGYGDMDSWLDDETTPFLERFANLVAAHARKKRTQELMQLSDLMSFASSAECAAAIRARGDK